MRRVRHSQRSRLRLRIARNSPHAMPISAIVTPHLKVANFSAKLATFRCRASAGLARGACKVRSGCKSSVATISGWTTNPRKAVQPTKHNTRQAKSREARNATFAPSCFAAFAPLRAFVIQTITAASRVSLLLAGRRLAQVALIVQPQLGRLAQFHRVQVESALAGRLWLLHRDAVRVGVGVLADAGHLPGDLQTRRAAGDLEAVILHLVRHVERRPAADGGELIRPLSPTKLPTETSVA